MTPATTTETPFARNASLDAARGILMMLGVVLHTANIYSAGGGWLVWDTERSSVFDTLAELIHVFRMPAFFWISGYFCALTFQRNGAGGLLRKRLPRLALPLLAAWLTLNVSQEVMMAAMRGQDEGDAVLDGVPLFHLWFLVDLLLYIALAALLLPLVRPLVTRFGPQLDWLEKRPLIIMLPALALFSEAFSVAARATGIAYEDVFGLTSLFRLASYAPYFIVGIFMYTHTQARETFLKTPLLLIVAALPLGVLAHHYTRGHGPLIGEAALGLEYLMIWISVAAILRVFHALFRSDNRITRFLSDAAYSVFLFHHIIVVALGVLLLDYPIGAWPKFFFIASVSLGLSALLHIAIIRRNRFARLLFNGK